MNVGTAGGWLPRTASGPATTKLVATATPNRTRLTPEGRLFIIDVCKGENKKVSRRPAGTRAREPARFETEQLYMSARRPGGFALFRAHAAIRLQERRLVGIAGIAGGVRRPNPVAVAAAAQTR